MQLAKNCPAQLKLLKEEMFAETESDLSESDDGQPPDPGGWHALQEIIPIL